jgi:hypothetical protein
MGPTTTMNKRPRPNPTTGSLPLSRDEEVEVIYIRVIQRDCRLRSGYNTNDPASIEKYSKMLREYPTHTLERMLNVLKPKGDVWERPDVIQNIIDEVSERILLRE